MVCELLARGYSVRAMLRDTKLASIFPNSDKLEIVKADLFDVGSLKNAVEGCEDVIHCAAALYVGAKDVKETLLTLQLLELRIYAV